MLLITARVIVEQFNSFYYLWHFTSHYLCSSKRIAFEVSIYCLILLLNRLI